MSGPSDHLLRTLAVVAPGTRTLDLGCAAGEHTEALARLGLDVWACDPDRRRVDAVRQRLRPLVDDAERRVVVSRGGALGFPDAHFAWIAVTHPGPRAEWPETFSEVARVLQPGAWVWVEVAPADVGALEDAAEGAGLVAAEAPAPDAARGAVHAVFRRVGAGTVG